MGFFDIFKKKSDNGIKMTSPLKGKCVELSQVPDPTFGQGMLGKGVAIIPESGEVYAPCDGEVVLVFNTKHAISIKSKDGVEILIHVGLDTVNLQGECFEVKVKQGDMVKQGDLLSVADLEGIKKAGYNTITPMIVCNTDDYANVEAMNTEKSVEKTTEVLKITK